MLTAATVISSSVNYSLFWTAYVDVMAVMGIISAAVFILYQVVPGMFSAFPNYVWHGNILMKNLEEISVSFMNPECIVCF